MTAGYVISYAKGRTIGASRLIKATLTLSRADLHAIEQTLVVERGGEVREYRFVEASFERLPSKTVNPAVFEAINRSRGDNAYDPEVWTGFAFGFGIERLAMRRHMNQAAKRFSAGWGKTKTRRRG